MRLFKRHKSEPKSDNATTTDDSQQKSRGGGGVFRLFHHGGSAAAAQSSKESSQPLPPQQPQPQLQLASLLDDGFETAAASKRSAAAATDADQTCDSSPANYNSTNQNYTPEVGLSPDALSPMLPTVLPLRRPTDSHNSGASVNTDAKAAELARFQRWQRRKPHFHFGPRRHPDEEGDSERRGSVSASSGSAATDNIITLPAKYAFIYQDGKFVEREVTRWQKPQRVTPHLRYRNLEPYASHYGRRYRRRLDSEERIVSIRHRLIYQNPIYRLPRRIMEENKSRLMTRHSLKDSFEGSKKVGGPQKVEVGEREQSKMVKKRQERHNLKEAEKLVNYITVKGKTASDASSAAPAVAPPTSSAS